ncbi:hypothetical protein [Bradyrhizobium sp. 159]|uniref:hypothetical protein n=2 Tax=Bradyrhizobium TaxID=374 RepID=UPI001FFA7A1C|nr:hypothetical protein [Bradyrhizobium sp. 159]
MAIIFREITLISISSIRQRVLMHEDQARRMLLCREQLIISDEPGLDEGVQNQVCTRTRNSEEQHAKVDLVAHLSGRQAGLIRQVRYPEPACGNNSAQLH